MGTKNNPGDFDCYENAEPDEPMFVLLGRDPCGPSLVRMWIQMRLDLGTISGSKAEEAFKCVDDMEAWSGEHGASADARGAFRVISHYAANGGDMNRGRK